MANRDLIAGTGITFDDTVADELTINAAGGGGAWEVISSQVVSTPVASVDFTSGIDGTYDNYVIEITGAVNDIDNRTVSVRLSNDGGISFITGTAYKTHLSTSITASATVSASNNNAGSSFTIASSVGNDAGECYAALVNLFNTQSSSVNTSFSSQGCAADPAGNGRSASAFGLHDSTEVHNAFRVLPSTGNITAGTFTLYGIKNS